MGNHRPLPYEGLHYSKKSPTPGLLGTAVIVVGALIAAIVFLFGAWFLADQFGVPIKLVAESVQLGAIAASGTPGV